MTREAYIPLGCESVVGRVVPDVWKDRGALESSGTTRLNYTVSQAKILECVATPV